MSKLNQILIIALIAQAGLIALFSAGSNDATILPPTKVFAGFDPAKVSKVVVVDAPGDKGETPKAVTLEKSGASWVLPGADGFPVDPEKIKTFLESVGKLTARGPVVSRDTYYDKLEVSDAKYQRKVTVTHDGKALGFYLGSSPSFKRIHLRKADGKEVFVVSGIAAYDVHIDRRGWVDTKYVNTPASEVWAMSIERGKERLEFEKGAGDMWALLGATKALKKADVEGLVKKAATIDLQTPVGKALKPEYGLDAAAVTVTLVTGTSTIAGVPPKTTKRQKIRVGKMVKLDDVEQFYVKADSSEYVVTAPKWAVEDLLNKKADDLFE